MLTAQLTITVRQTVQSMTVDALQTMSPARLISRDATEVGRARPPAELSAPPTLEARARLLCPPQRPRRLRLFLRMDVLLCLLQSCLPQMSMATSASFRMCPSVLARLLRPNLKNKLSIMAKAHVPWTSSGTVLLQGQLKPLHRVMHLRRHKRRSPHKSPCYRGSIELQPRCLRRLRQLRLQRGRSRFCRRNLLI